MARMLFYSSKINYFMCVNKMKEMDNEHEYGRYMSKKWKNYDNLWKFNSLDSLSRYVHVVADDDGISIFAGCSPVPSERE